MNRNTISAAVPPHWWERLKGAQFGFIGGLLIGLLLGWFFHGVISLAVRLGFLVLLLLPLIGALLGLLWAGSGNMLAGLGMGAVAGTFIGWFVAAAMLQKKENK